MGVGRHTPRNLLHRDKFIFFKKWVELTREYEVMPPTGHAYEVFRIRKIHLAPGKTTRTGDSRDIFFYQKELPTQHVTTCAEGEALVKRWLKARKAPKAESLDDNEASAQARMKAFFMLRDEKISLNQFIAQMKDLGWSKEDTESWLDEEDYSFE